MPVMVMRRRTRSSVSPALARSGIDPSEILGQAIELDEPSLDGDALILLGRLDGEPRAPLGREEVAPQGANSMAFTLSSSAFGNGKRIPNRHSRAGGNVSPALEWHDAPPGTKSFVLIVEDPDAPRGTFRH